MGRLTIALAAAALAVVTAAGSVGCGTKTSVTQLWSAPVPASVPPMRKVVVMATRMDEASRRAMEDSLVAALALHGVHGVPSYKLFPGELPPREEAQATVESMQIDGILTANFKGIRETLTYAPRYYAGGFWSGYYGWGWGWGGSYYDGYLDTDELVNVETTLWDARAPDTIVWAALTTTRNPRSGHDFVESVTEKVIPALAESRFIPLGPKGK